ncbi:hypothetical protein [Ramlibacter sp. AN1133]|uniref:hypothetical protein n=1 Tax=Ramlibacter sp. AN1133 TaxID=3133429 RepID=UPI0030C6296E
MTSNAEISPILTKPSTTSEPAIVTFAVSDPEVLLAMGEYPEGQQRTNFLVTALKIGVLSLKAAKGTLDSDTVRREGEHLMTQLGERLNTWRGKLEDRVTNSLSKYFDPSEGLFTDRVNRLTKADGELATVVQLQVREAQQTLGKVFEQFIGENSDLLKALDPSGDNQLVATLQRTLDGVVQAQNAAILTQFSLDNKEGALVRFLSELRAKHGDLTEAFSKDMAAVVAEFSLDKPDSALSRLVGRVEETQSKLTNELSLDNEGSALKRISVMLQEHQRVNVETSTKLVDTLNAAVQAMQVRRQEAARGTQHGLEFEDSLAAALRELVAAGGDVVEQTGATTGVIPHCKVGDHVVTIGPEKIAAGARIVFEAKQHASYDLARSLEEADTARRNRDAAVCVFVHSARTAQPSIPQFQRFGNDVMLRWDAEDASSDVWLRAAHMVATAISVRAASHGKKDAKSFATIDGAIERIRKQLNGFDEMNTSANTAMKAVEAIQRKAKSMEKDLMDQLSTLQEEAAKLKARDEAAE